MKISVKDIILDTDPRIRTKSEQVPLPLSAEDSELLEAMIAYVRDSQDEEIAKREGLRPAVGIAAIQLGIPKALIAVSVPTEEGSDEFALANPRIVSESVQNAYLAQGEGCLSVAEEHEGLVLVMPASRSPATTCSERISSGSERKAIPPSASSMRSIIFPASSSMTASTRMTRGKKIRRRKSSVISQGTHSVPLVLSSKEKWLTKQMPSL